MVEIESQLFRPDIGTLLRRLLAHDFVQGPMKQMRDRVMSLNRVRAAASTATRTASPDLGSAARRSARYGERNTSPFSACWHLQAADLRPVGARHMDDARIADLSAHFGVACRAVHDQFESYSALFACDTDSTTASVSRKS